MTAQAGVRQYWQVSYFCLSTVAAGALVYLLLQIVLALTDGPLVRALQTVPATAISLATIVYLLGHVFRSMRLALLIGGWNVGLRLITSFHFMTAGVGIAMPLKLGDLYRIAALSRLLSSLTRSVEIVWWERILDSVTLIVIMLAALRNVPNGSWQQFAGVIALSVSFIALSVLVFFILPDNLRRTSVLIIRRYDSPRTVPFLRMLEKVRRTILEAPRMVRGKMGSLVALTVLIWTCEIGAFAVILAAMGRAIAAAPDSLLKLLSVLVGGKTLVDALNTKATLLGGFLPYLAATQAPLAFVGLLAGIIYASERMRQ
jgi:hypothetical protein